MKRILNIITLMAATALLSVGCTETLEYAREDKSVPVIESFSPASAPIGSTITIEGNYLNRVTAVKIGGVEVPILERISNTRITIIAASTGKNGVIEATNQFGTGTSTDSFTYAYVAPVITAVAPTVNMGDNIMLTGENLSVAQSVLFTAQGFSGHQATIVSINSKGTEMVVRVPYVEDNLAKITFSYYNGTAVVESPVATAPEVTVIRNAPDVTTTTFTRTDVGRSFTIEGTYLNKIDTVKVGGFTSIISAKSHTSLTFTIPAGDFTDGENTTDIVIVYFDGNETRTIAPAFTVFVPYVKFWENIRTWTQGRGVMAYPYGAFASFFSPETGIVYWNGDWAAKLDPISDKYRETICTANNAVNKTVVTNDEYNSVAPYFFFSGSTSNNNIQINSPANSNSQLRNFYYEDNSNSRIIPGATSTTACYGTPMMTFRLLNPGNPTELALINAVKNQTLDKIDETTFPIDVPAKTIKGIGCTSAAGAPASTATTGSNQWSADCSGQVLKENVTVDAVLLVMYYNIDGPQSAAGYVTNIKRIGLLHIKSVNYRPSTSAASFNSDVLYNMYWQKYDYDYSKL